MFSQWKQNRKLSNMWKQDEKVIQPLKGVSVKARWKGCPDSEDKMKKLSGQWRQDEKVVRPVKTKLIISNPLFVYNYGYITDSLLGLDICSRYWPYSYQTRHNVTTTADTPSVTFARTIIFSYWVLSEFEFVHENKNVIVFPAAVNRDFI